MNLAELQEELAAGTIRPAYLLAGEEPLLREDALRAIERAVVDPGAADWNRDRLDGESVDPGALLDAVRALPVMAERRLVWLREPEGRRRATEAFFAALVEAVGLAVASEETVLVVTAAKIDKRSKWVKAWKEPAGFVECDPPKPGRALLAFVQAEAKAQGVELERAAAELLAERTGPRLLVLRQEIAKAALHAGPGEKVGRSHVNEGVAEIAEEPVWDLTDAIGQGRAADALRVLSRLRAGGTPDPVVLGALASHFRRLARLRTGGDVRAHPFAKKKLEQQARRYAPAQLRNCLRAIQDTDLALKGAASIPDLALERLVLGLAG